MTIYVQDIETKSAMHPSVHLQYANHLELWKAYSHTTRYNFKIFETINNIPDMKTSSGMGISP